MKEPSSDPRQIERQQNIAAWEATESNCMRHCFASLSKDRRMLLALYATADDEAKKVIAARLGIKLSNLTTRVHQVREGLRKCKDACLKQAQK